MRRFIAAFAVGTSVFSCLVAVVTQAELPIEISGVMVAIAYISVRRDHK